MKLEGDASIKKVKQLHAALKEELKNSSEVIVDMAGLATIDASVAQLLLAATMKAKETGKELRLENIPAGLNKTLALAGLAANTTQGGDE